MLRHLTLLAVIYLCGSIIHAIPVDVESTQNSNVNIQKSTDDLDTAASSWSGYGIKGWFGPSYYGGNWDGRGHHGHGWGNRGHHYGSGWNGWGSGWGSGWGNQGYGNGWGNNYGYGSGWHGNRGSYWW
ncbi:protein suex-1-like [Phymastichus coffea]|uniref:protein suex-1-like n=1 Tax=Phymastichus coffea TaxID=108790 RepID=UPI00273A85B0|nr:protein suex-1-like [Phymastichus coffea]